ncbi:uncharacterized protein [Phaseolus vulgaris]|uniref:uncharacterized protein n=1 Tax=Phaseolus vulgaris TaxID=3885 RepID=UPI0035CC612E
MAEDFPSIISKAVENSTRKLQDDLFTLRAENNSIRIEAERVSQWESSKEMFDTLEVTHEGTNDVKRARKYTLIQEYEMFRMLKGESIADVQKRFTHIVNHLMILGKVFDKKELNMKILKCLDRSW